MEYPFSHFDAYDHAVYVDVAPSLEIQKHNTCMVKVYSNF